MQITFKVGTAFEKRLAELAWEHADDMTKHAIAGTVALSITSDMKALAQLASRIVDSIHDKCVDVAMQSEHIAEAVATAKDTFSEGLIDTIVSTTLSDPVICANLVAKAAKSIQRSLVERIHGHEAFVKATNDSIDSLVVAVKETNFATHANTALRRVVDDRVKNIVSVGDVAEATRHTDLNAAIQLSLQTWVEKQTHRYMHTLQTDLTFDSKRALLTLLQNTMNELTTLSPKPPPVAP